MFPLLVASVQIRRSAINEVLARLGVVAVLAGMLPGPHFLTQLGPQRLSDDCLSDTDQPVTPKEHLKETNAIGRVSHAPARLAGWRDCWSSGRSEFGKKTLDFLRGAELGLVPNSRVRHLEFGSRVREKDVRP